MKVGADNGLPTLLGKHGGACADKARTANDQGIDGCHELIIA
jgi:hypothetical protein